MKSRRLWLTFALGSSLVLGSAMGLGGCSSIDPDEGGLTKKNLSTRGANGATGDDDASGGTDVDGGGGTTTGDGGTGGADPFAGAPAFAAGTAPAKNSNDAPVAQKTQHTQQAPINCRNAGCHGQGTNPAAAGPIWSGAGIIYANKGSTAAFAPGVQIVIKQPDGTFLQTYSDQNGRFVFPEGTTIPAGSRIMVRNATVKQVMPATTTVPAAPINCMNAGCHIATTLYLNQ